MHRMIRVGEHAVRADRVAVVTVTRRQGQPPDTFTVTATLDLHHATPHYTHEVRGDRETVFADVVRPMLAGLGELSRRGTPAGFVEVAADEWVRADRVAAVQHAPSVVNVWLDLTNAAVRWTVYPPTGETTASWRDAIVGMVDAAVHDPAAVGS